jgi:DNA-binding NarL/FixJ family response regulator
VRFGDLQENARQLLGSQADFEIACECVDASGAVGKAGEMQPNVVILDTSLPDMDGLEVLRHQDSLAFDRNLAVQRAHMVERGWRPEPVDTS